MASEVNKLQHVWKPADAPKQGHICTTCNCIRYPYGSYKGQPLIWYERSGIDFFEKEPECLDWEDNTLN